MKAITLLLFGSIVAALAVSHASAQFPPPLMPCNDTMPNPYGSAGPACTALDPSFSTTAVPLMDGSVSTVWPPSPLPNGQIVTLYGSYGNTESSGAALNHANQGQILASNIQPRCTDGTIPPPNTLCSNNKAPATIFLFIGFSNCDIETCGGNTDAWDQSDPNQVHLAGQPCATRCPNLNNPDFPNAWNQVTSGGSDGVTQQSFLYQVYHPTPRLVGSHVVIWDGAFGQQTLDRWDPTPIGHYAQHNDCTFDQYTSVDPECNYIRVHDDLAKNGYTEAQVQAVYLKSSDSYPQCDLSLQHCNTTVTTEPDAFTGERFMGNIMRYLKCCKLDGNGHSTGIPRYANLQQVFITSRIYGGYGNGTAHGCLSPEPFAYEEGFSVQRLIVAQINQTNAISSPDTYSGQVDYSVSPWFDWGPYLWANGEAFNSAGLNWCNGQTDSFCSGQRDVRYGDLNDPVAFWGDFTHPTAGATQKVANQLLIFIGKDPNHIKPGSPWVTPWIQQ